MLIETVVRDCADLADKLTAEEASGSSAASAISTTEGIPETRRTIIDTLEPYLALSVDDVPLIELLIKTNEGQMIETENQIVQLLKSLAKSSFVRDLPVNSRTSEDAQVERELAVLGSLVWFTLDINQTAAKKLPVLLMEAYNSNVVGEKAFTTWETLSYEEFRRFLPSFYKTAKLLPYSGATNAKLPFAESFAQEKYLNKSSEKDFLFTEALYAQHKKILAKFLEWMNQSDEEDDDEDDEEEEED